MGYTLDAISASLREPGDGVFRDLGWLTQSWEQPDAFAAALRLYQAALDPAPLKSAPRKGHDLYHDLVLRNAAGGRVALYWLDVEGSLRRLTYAELHVLCTAQRTQWSRRGVHAGQRLCVLAEPGHELCVPLLTGLRMGLEVSLLPPAGPLFLDRRLQALNADWVATAERYVPLLRRTTAEHKILLGEESPLLPLTVADAASHTYEDGSTALQLFSPAHQPPAQPVAVTAAAAYHGALRDGLLLLGLAPGQVVAVAEHDLLQMQPALLLATLLRGAALLFLRARDFVREGPADDRLTRLPAMHVLVVSTGLRMVMLEAPPRPIFGTLNLWLHSPQEAAEVTRWSDWAQRWGLQATPAMSLLWDAPSGGSVLFSRRRAGLPPAYLMPSPGLHFTFGQPDNPDEPARSASGAFRAAPTANRLLLTRVEGGYLYAGTPAPDRDAPGSAAAEVEQAVQGLPFVRGASLVQEPDARGRSTLLIFTGPETAAYARNYLEYRQHLAQTAISQRLSPSYLPAQIIVASQLPRLLSGGGIDHRWCAQLLLSGELHRRGQDPLAALLDRLQASLPFLLARKS